MDMTWTLPLLTALAIAQSAVSPKQTDTERIASMYATYRAAFSGVPEVTPDGLGALQDPVLVDIREPAEQAVSMIPGALTEAAFLAQRDALSGRPVVAYCTIGARSGVWVAEQRAAGVDAHNLVGSILAWTHAGGALVTPDGTPTKRVHVYGSTWDLAADGYDTTW